MWPSEYLVIKCWNSNNPVPVASFDGEHLNLTRISRSEMGVYLCIATNGVPPSVSKRVVVDVECKYLHCTLHLCLSFCLSHNRVGLRKSVNILYMRVGSSQKAVVWPNKNDRPTSSLIHIVLFPFLENFPLSQISE